MHPPPEPGSRGNPERAGIQALGGGCWASTWPGLQNELVDPERVLSHLLPAPPRRKLHATWQESCFRERAVKVHSELETMSVALIAHSVVQPSPLSLKFSEAPDERSLPWKQWLRSPLCPSARYPLRCLRLRDRAHLSTRLTGKADGVVMDTSASGLGGASGGALGLSRLHVVPFCKILFSKPSSFSVFPLPPSPPPSFLCLPFSPRLAPSPTQGAALRRITCVNSLYLEHPSSQTGVHVAPLARFPPRFPAAFAKPQVRSVGHVTPAGQRPGSGWPPGNAGPGPQALKEPQR
ncbi:unnamed protein product [Rangifer tarandus platyrhynchus]|uniref:Uncharacterized protein n=2 Tax=Rangifer tarandus platyrhynchus TaxID=3082113 RepID=A0ACB0F3Q7_RANTA|nr:unnamed protein product [Rangifer tarandus platyrhynchus]CAI9707717.1 unnamed protein product [Rangifer tarandus platyrhynchus]